MVLKRALLIGINYIGTPYKLDGCINDVLNMTTFLRRYYPQCREFRLLTDTMPASNKPTKTNILNAFTWATTGLKPGDSIYIHYSGHGGTIADTNGDEKTNSDTPNMDSIIYPCNNGKLEMITDDELRTFLIDKIPAGVKCFTIFDCCHSGSILDLRYNYQAPTQNSITMTQDSTYTSTKGDVLFLSGCRDSQTAADTVDTFGKPCGATTWALQETWKKYGINIKLKYLLWDIRSFLKVRKYDQIPQLSTGRSLDMNKLFVL
jgi:hypothetical protein